ncbi:hypothetical protein [Gracilimonas tropica]|uniref:hypothetical protein n=1 Tax=Gracilimonas tropica TaxID=454600 RepID=UPI0003622DCC|nr:hypothetical protein [Gracilimonas tropica]
MPEGLAQTTISNQKTLEPLSVDSTYFLGNWVLRESILIKAGEEVISGENWIFVEQSGSIQFTQPFWTEREITSVTVFFEELPVSWPRSFQSLVPVELDSAFFEDRDSLQLQLQSGTPQTVFGPSGLRQSGSLSRGVIVGSNQDFSLESGLNFELSGPLTENINITASLTDQSIPIQPDGTTQNLREFDKVFIQVEAPNASVEMGDVDVSLQQSTFAQYNRRLQGAAGSVNSEYGDYTGAASVVRGTYKSMQFQGQDGVQGPYRLTGRNGEQFVIILAGTERVYINGQQVQRGAENDYIIDYGLGEVSFTNNVLIKDETRIVIEYEYIDRDFNRTVVAAEGGAELFGGRASIGVSAIRQADGDDLLSQRSLSEQDIALLQDVGDDLDEAVVSGASVASEEERDQFLLYARIDTTVNGETYTIFQHQPGAEGAIYRVRFSNVGEGNGSYLRASGQTNGLLYEWVGPGAGNYEPARQLPAPQKQQMVALNGNVEVSKNIEVFGEWAVSDLDKNRFSSLDDGDNTDLGYEAGLRIKEAETAIGVIDARITRRYTGRRFEFFERTRDVEFDRKWNITRTGQSREAIDQVALSVQPTAFTRIAGEIGQVQRDGFRGIRQASSIRSEETGWLDLSYSQDWVQSDDELLDQDGTWFRQQGNMSRGFGLNDKITITPYVRFEQEKRLQRSLTNDSLLSNSLSFYDIGPGLQVNLASLELNAGIAYRDERGVLGNKLEDLSTAVEQRYSLRFSPSTNFETRNEIRFRDKTYAEDFVEPGRQNRKGILVKSVTNYSTKSRILEGEFFYEANTQRQALLQEAYIEVGPEIGQFVWDDLNGDGVQQVDEFFPEVSANEGTFIRQFLPSDELLPAVDLNVRMINTIQPFVKADETLWYQGIRLRSRADILENSTTQNLKDIYLLNLASFRNDSTTIQGRIFWEQELDVFRDWQGVDLKFGAGESRGLNRRSSESIQNYSSRFYVNTGYGITNRIRLKLDAQRTENSSSSDIVSNRNFDIESYSLEPGLNGTISRNWNAGLNVSFIRKEDRQPVENTKARLLKISTTQRLYLWRKVQSTLRMEFRNTVVDGNSTPFGRYELTEGTGEGINFLWSLRSTYRMSNLIRLSLDYDGRTVKDRPTIHTIKLVMSATL